MASEVGTTAASFGIATGAFVNERDDAADQATARLGRRDIFENMDATKAFGRNVADLRTVFDSFPQAGFCLDVAHVWTNDPTLALGHDLLDAFGERLRELHVSGIEPDSTHRPTTAAELGLHRALLDRCRHVPWLLEAELDGVSARWR